MNVKRYEEGEIVRGTICLKDNIVVGPKGRCTIDKEQGFAIGFCLLSVTMKLLST